jgi:acetolactate synthase-1/2/3 large subunit
MNRPTNDPSPDPAAPAMNGAESLVRTFAAGGIEVCFANPGTSEMHFVAALDRVEGVRPVLCLAEGVVTGAADGYGRMTDKPAATLLHLGPGLANGLANLHNARRARTPIINVVGEHATHHRRFDAPLTADIEALAAQYSVWLRTSEDSRSVAADGAAAIAAASAPPGGIATLVLPADTAWGAGGPVASPLPVPARARVDEARVATVAALLRSGEPVMLLVGDRALRADGLALAGRVAARTGARLMAPMGNARMERGAGRVAIERVPYPVDQAVARLAGIRHLVLCGAVAPVAFFGYPGKPSEIKPPDCAVHVLAEPAEDGVDALARLAEAVGAAGEPAPVAAPARPALPTGGALDPAAVAAVIGALLPENAIVVDESITTGRDFFAATAGAAPHDWLQLTGGAIGIGVPLATGAAIACPDRQVVALQADGSAMYTLQGLWTQAREGLKVLTCIWANRSYAILTGELAGVGADPGPKALDMLSLERPTLDWVHLARGMGVEATRVETPDAFARAIRAGLAASGPYLVEVVL